MSKLRVDEITSTDNGIPNVKNHYVQVGSIAELEALSLDEGVHVYLTQEYRAGDFTVKVGTPPSDPNKGFYIVLANGNYAERSDKRAVNVLWFGADPDDVLVDDKSAFEQAILQTGTVYVPPGDGYFVSSQIDLVGGDSVILYGEPTSISNDKAPSVDIYAPSGLFKTTDTSRSFVTLSSLAIRGQAGEPKQGICLEGRIGVRADSVLFENYISFVENDYFYLCYFNDCSFDGSDLAFSIGTYNGTSFDDCWFGSSNKICFDNTQVVTGGQSATNNGLPIRFKNINFNVSGSSKFIAKLMGLVVFESCYVEVFGENPAELGPLFYYKANNFVNAGIHMLHCELNGQGHRNELLEVIADNSIGARTNGQIKFNRILGFNSQSIIIGSTTKGASARVIGMEVSKNLGSSGTGNYVSYGDPANSFTQYFKGALSADTAISGTTYTALPINKQEGTIAHTDGTSGVDANVGGLYLLTVNIVHAITDATPEYRGTEFRIENLGVPIISTVSSIQRGTEGGAWYANATMSTVIQLEAPDNLVVQGRNGGTVTGMDFSLVRISE